MLSCRLSFPRAVSLLIALGLAVAPAAPGGAVAQQPGLKTGLGRAEAKSVEDHIATLRATLHVTAAQEPQWQSLAAAMRASVAELDRAYAERQRQDGTQGGRTGGQASAVDNLKSYGRIQQIKADNVRSLIGPFEKLYDSFDAGQRKQADETFRKFTENAVKGYR